MSHYLDQRVSVSDYSRPSIAEMRADPDQDQLITDRLIEIDQERRRRLARRNIATLRRELKRAVQ